MCFSATASIGSGIVLSAVGIVSIKKVSNHKDLLFASIPLLFALQQFVEGILWISLSNFNFALYERPATYLFLTFAQVVWPIWVPLSVLFLSNDEKYKKALLLLTATGAFVSSYLLFCLYNFPVNASILDHHINYQLDFPSNLKFMVGICYFSATVLPCLFSKYIKMKYLALTILGSYIFTQLFFTAYFISVWCFFAAIISILVWAIIDDLQISARKSLTTEA